MFHVEHLPRQGSLRPRRPKKKRSPLHLTCGSRKWRGAELDRPCGPVVKPSLLPRSVEIQTNPREHFVRPRLSISLDAQHHQTTDAKQRSGAFQRHGGRPKGASHNDVRLATFSTPPNVFGPAGHHTDARLQFQQANEPTQHRGPPTPSLNQEPACRRLRKGQGKRGQAAAASEVDHSRSGRNIKALKKPECLLDLLHEIAWAHRPYALCLTQTRGQHGWQWARKRAAVTRER